MVEIIHRMKVYGKRGPIREFSMPCNVTARRAIQKPVNPENTCFVFICLFIPLKDRLLHCQRYMVITSGIRWTRTAASLVPSQNFPTGRHHTHHRKLAVGDTSVEDQNGSPRNNSQRKEFIQIAEATLIVFTAELRMSYDLYDENKTPG